MTEVKKVNLTERRSAIAEELSIDLEDEVGLPADPEDLFACLSFHLENQRSDEIERFDQLAAELDALEKETMEQTDELA